MADRNNYRLNEEIESHIRQWDGTIHGQMVKTCTKTVQATKESVRLCRLITKTMRRIRIGAEQRTGSDDN